MPHSRVSRSRTMAIIPLQQRLTQRSHPLAKSQSAYTPQRLSLMSSQLPHWTSTKALPSVDSEEKKKNHQKRKREKKSVTEQSKQALIAPARTGHAEGTEIPLAPPSTSGRNKPHSSHGPRVNRRLCFNHVGHNGMLLCYCPFLHCVFRHVTGHASRNRKWRLGSCQKRINGSRTKSIVPLFQSN